MTTQNAETDWVAKLRALLEAKRGRGLTHMHVDWAEPTPEDLKDPQGLAQKRAKELYQVLTMPRWKWWWGSVSAEWDMWREEVGWKLWRKPRSFLRALFNYRLFFMPR